MADPISAMAVTSLIGGGVGAAVSAYGSYQGGQAGQAMQNYRARVAQINAGIAMQQAGVEEAAGGIRSQISGLRTGERMGLTRAGMAAGGLDLGTGSARQVLSSEAQVGQFEQGTITNEAERRAYASRVGAFSDTAQASLDVAAGKQEATAGDIGAVSSLLGGATQVSDKWTKFGEVGAFGNNPPYGDPSEVV